MIHARTDYQRIQDPEKKIPAEEPVFLLRAQDQTSAEVVRHWIKLNRRLLLDDKDISDVEKAARKKALVLAEAHVYRMEEWPVKKPADVV